MNHSEKVTKVHAQPGPRSQQLLEWKNSVVARGISNSVPIFVDKAKGAVVEDVDGNTYIDFYGGIGVLNAGHCPPPVVDAIQKQAEKLLHTSFMVTMYESYVQLAAKLVEISPGPSKKKAMFVNSGAEAVENAIKIARSFSKKPGVIAFDRAFHGRTLLTMSLTSKVKPYKFGFGPFAPEIYRIPYAYCYRCSYNCTYPGCGMRCLEQFKHFFAAESAAENIGALIVEPVQGEGGFVVPPKEFLPGLQAICKENDIVFIVDEVQSGFGRTGRMFAYEHWDIEPDLVTVAKSIASGMPLSGVVGKAEIMDAPGPGQIGGTYGGNPVSCAAGMATIDYLLENNLIERSNVIGARAVSKLKELQERYAMIGDVRGLGGMVAVEFVKDRQTKEPAKEETTRILQECHKQGLLVIGAGVFGNVIRMLMPLSITDEQLDEGLKILADAMAKYLK